MDARMRHRDRRGPKHEAAALTLALLLLATRILSAADGVSIEMVAVLLALKEGPRRPEEIARRLGVRPAIVRQRLYSARASSGVSSLLGLDRDGRYRLTLKGHRFVNRIAGYGYHLLLASDAFAP